jgi:hypothetical protein
MATPGLYSIRLPGQEFSLEDIKQVRKDAEEEGLRTEVIYDFTNLPLLLIIGDPSRAKKFVKTELSGSEELHEEWTRAAERQTIHMFPHTSAVPNFCLQLNHLGLFGPRHLLLAYLFLVLSDGVIGCFHSTLDAYPVEELEND